MATKLAKGAFAILILVILLSAFGFAQAKKPELKNPIIADKNFEQTLNSCKPASGLQKNYVKTGSPIISGQAILLMPSKNSDLDKLKSSFDFVSKGISYKVYGSWRYPEEVLDSKNGDCTDKSILLASLLRSKGIEAYVVEGKKINGYSHAWVAAKIDNKWVQVDPTSADVNYIYNCVSDKKCKNKERYKIASIFNENQVFACTTSSNNQI